MHYNGYHHQYGYRVWDTSQPSSPLLETVSHHTEFTFGLDISPHSPPGLVSYALVINLLEHFKSPHDNHVGAR